jgi:alpha-L-fucosidase 2
LLRLLVGRGDPNLLCEHPPFQIDGNFGGTAAICEMLVQTNDTEIELLPALPTAWKKGRVRGICVVGANELSFAWERQADGALKIYDLTVKSGYMKKVQLRIGDKVHSFDVEPGKVTPINF